MRPQGSTVAWLLEALCNFWFMARPSIQNSQFLKAQCCLVVIYLLRPMCKVFRSTCVCVCLSACLFFGCLSARICHKKLSYRKGTARRAILVNFAILPGMGVRKVLNSEVILEDFSASEVTTIWRYTNVYIIIIIIISENLKKSRNSEHIPFRSNISCVHNYSCVSSSTWDLRFPSSPIQRHD